MTFVLRKLRDSALFAGALLFLCEEWLWERLKACSAWLGRLPGMRDLETWIARLPPHGALALLVLPALFLYPFKIGALWMIADGRLMLGGTVMIAAKLVSTTIVARLFTICRPQLLRLPWFARLHDRILVWRTRVHAWLAQQPAWHAARRTVHALRRRGLAWARAMRPKPGTASQTGKRGVLLRWRARRQARRAAAGQPRA